MAVRPSGLTPNQPSKRPTARRQLMCGGSTTTSRTNRYGSYGTKWSTEDKLALINFVLLHGDGMAPIGCTQRRPVFGKLL